jgi:hypothetical protein
MITTNKKLPNAKKLFCSSRFFMFRFHLFRIFCGVALFFCFVLAPARTISAINKVRNFISLYVFVCEDEQAEKQLYFMLKKFEIYHIKKSKIVFFAFNFLW